MAAVGAPQTVDSSESELLFKVLVVGELGVGKTSIIKRTVHNIYNQNYKATVGVDFALKVVEVKRPSDQANVKVKLQLWDIAGQERFGQMTHVYYKSAVAAFVVFDLTRQASLDACVKWKEDIDQKVFLGNEQDKKPIPVILLGNKCDSKDPQVANIESFAAQHNFVQCLKTSAKENIQLNEAITAIVNEIFKLPTSSTLSAVDPSRVKLDASGESSAKGGCPC